MLTNNEIIARCILKDRQAQKLLYEKYTAKMFGYCLRYSNNRADAQDLLQDGFIKVFDSISSLKETAHLEAWMSRIFINLSLSRFRKLARGPIIVEVDDILDESIRDVYSVELEPMEINEVLKCMRELPEKYRLVLNMYAIDKMGHKEIAEALGTSLNNSKSLLHRARIMLKKEVFENNRNKETEK